MSTEVLMVTQPSRKSIGTLKEKMKTTMNIWMHARFQRKILAKYVNKCMLVIFLMSWKQPNSSLFIGINRFFKNYWLNDWLLLIGGLPSSPPRRDPSSPHTVQRLLPRNNSTLANKKKKPPKKKGEQKNIILYVPDNTEAMFMLTKNHHWLDKT